MKHFIQFKALSTGYIQGSIPPKFSDDNIKPINSLGSDGIYYLDNRLSLENMINKGINLCKVKNNKIGFSIVRYNNSILDGKEIKTIIF
jgi:hypothetical protein